MREPKRGHKSYFLKITRRELTKAADRFHVDTGKVIDEHTLCLIQNMLHPMLCTDWIQLNIEPDFDECTVKFSDACVVYAYWASPTCKIDSPTDLDMFNVRNNIQCDNHDMISRLWLASLLVKIRKPGLLHRAPRWHDNVVAEPERRQKTKAKHIAAISKLPPPLWFAK